MFIELNGTSGIDTAPRSRRLVALRLLATARAAAAGAAGSTASAAPRRDQAVPAAATTTAKRVSMQPAERPMAGLIPATNSLEPSTRRFADGKRFRGLRHCGDGRPWASRAGPTCLPSGSRRIRLNALAAAGDLRVKPVVGPPESRFWRATWESKFAAPPILEPIASRQAGLQAIRSERPPKLPGAETLSYGALQLRIDPRRPTEARSARALVRKHSDAGAAPKVEDRLNKTATR